MPIFDIFTSSINYKYKTTLCSFSTLFVLALSIITLVGPLVIVHLSGGFWLRNSMYMEIPEITFKQKYLLLAESGFDSNSVVCSTFATYKENKIADNCTLIKVQEADTNNDGLKDVLKFEAHFYTDVPIRSMKLLLFFNYNLTKLVQTAMETMAVVDYTLPYPVQEIYFVSDLKLRQKSVLQKDNIHNLYNQSIDLDDLTVHQLLIDNAKKALTVQITNTEFTWHTGFSNDREFLVQGEIFYLQVPIYYQVDIWEDLKWAWMQYVSILLVFIYITKRCLYIAFTGGYLKSYIVRPEKVK
ncbi:transmembrane protein 231 [Orussus abietinus]|uniref:transmembrane protein 231 n=1 Tax=Orussus abietinus TaxID=222816 RepID=UPI000625E2A0|nr:transmembrane protein 231 [Orussus abietinus]